MRKDPRTPSKGWTRYGPALLLGLLLGLPSVAAFNPDHLPAVWLARPADTIKVDAERGEPLLTLGGDSDRTAPSASGHPPALAVDPLRGRLWSLRGDRLSAYAFDGAPLAESVFPVAARSPLPPPTMVITPSDGTPWIAVGAIAHGKEAAVSIERYLDGVDMAEGREPIKIEQPNYRPIGKDAARWGRAKMPELRIAFRRFR